MRILITTDAVGGVWNHVLTLVRGLVERGDACMVAIVGEPSAEQLSALPTGVEWQTMDATLEWLPSATEQDLAATTGWLRGLAVDWRADVVHLNQFGYAAADFGVPTVVAAHSDVLSWFREVRLEEPGEEWQPYARWVRAGLAAADLVVAPTAYQANMLGVHYGRVANHVIHNGVPAPVDAPGGPASERPFLVTAGRAWDEAKGMAVLDAALEALGETAPSAHLVGAVEGPAGERYVPRRLNAHGRVSHGSMHRLYENGSIYVAASLYEPFGLAPLEAAFHGCALVLSDIGSFRELWQDAAVFATPGSPGALADALAALLSDPARIDVLGTMARARAVARYTADRMVREYRRLYRRLSGEGRVERALHEYRQVEIAARTG